MPDTLGFTVDGDGPTEPRLDVVRTAGVTSAAPWFTFTAGGDETGDGFAWLCSLNGADETACSPGRTFPLTATGSQLLPGDNTLTVRAIDLAGNTGEAATLEFEADTSLPTVAFSNAGRQSGAATVFAFDASEPGAVYACGLDDDGLGPCPAGTVQGDGSGRATFGNLSEGAHILKVRARDAHGNLGPIAEGTVVVDRTGPTVRFTAPGATSGAVARAEWTLDPATVGQGESAWTYTCTLDGDPLDGCANPMEIGGLTDGEHTLTVTATDEARQRRPDGQPHVDRERAAGRPGHEPRHRDPRHAHRGRARGQRGEPHGRRPAGRLRPSRSRRSASRASRSRSRPRPARRRCASRCSPSPAAPTVRGASARAAKAKRTLVATVFKRTPKAKTYRFKLKDGKLSRLKPGRYVVEVRAGSSRTRLGKAKVKAFVVRGR